MTEYPLGDIIRNKDADGRIVKWAMELCPFSLEFAISKQYLLIDGKLWRKNAKEEILMKCIT